MPEGADRDTPVGSTIGTYHPYTDSNLISFSCCYFSRDSVVATIISLELMTGR